MSKEKLLKSFEKCCLKPFKIITRKSGLSEAKYKEMRGDTRLLHSTVVVSTCICTGIHNKQLLLVAGKGVSCRHRYEPGLQSLKGQCTSTLNALSCAENVNAHIVLMRYIFKM